jgi:cell division protease FtsH
VSAPTKPPPVRPESEGRQEPGPPPLSGWMWPVLIGLLLVGGLLLATLLLAPATESMDYSSFLAQVDAGRVETITIDADGRVTGTLVDDGRFSTQLPTALGPTDLASRLEGRGVQVVARAPTPGMGGVLLGLWPFLLLVGLLVLFLRRSQTQLGGAMSFGRSSAKLIEADRPHTRFVDVAGYEGVKREVAELIDFLRTPERFRRAGAIAPRGILLVGPPGTGKTLLARAVAGEAEVPFLSVTGSAFIEMFVGVGAARVRDLFLDARKRAPSIVFIDEIDALGSRVGGPTLGSHDERQQTLNQLLAEMDGFDPAEGLVVLAATNRPDALDPALLRPGRFDRQVVVPLPNLADRRAILAVHTRNKTLASDVDLDRVARATPGFSGADLANLANEAAINAARDDRATICSEDVEVARERIVLGRREDSSALLPEEKRIVAVHEAGHALVAALMPHADPVAKVTILPAGLSLGATHQLPVDERRLLTESHLTDALAVRMAGRAAEHLVLGEGSTGAAADVTSATELATRMVSEYGLSPAVGPVGYGSPTPTYIEQAGLGPRRYAEATQRLMDREVARLVREAEEAATALLMRHRGELDELAGMLLEEESIDGDRVYGLVGRPRPGEQPGDGRPQPLPR